MVDPVKRQFMIWTLCTTPTKDVIIILFPRFRFSCFQGVAITTSTSLKLRDREQGDKVSNDEDTAVSVSDYVSRVELKSICRSWRSDIMPPPLVPPI